MPPRKKQARGNAAGSSSTRRSTRTKGAPPNDDKDEVPEIYKEMLKEAYDANPADFDVLSRPAQKRKRSLEDLSRSVGTLPSQSSQVDRQHIDPPLSRRALQAKADARAKITSLDNNSQHDHGKSCGNVGSFISEAEVSYPKTVPPTLQTITSNDFDEINESDLEFEDVVIEHEHDSASEDEDAPLQEPVSIQLDLSAPAPSKVGKLVKRRPVTKSERLKRIEIHKAHLLCLIAHQAYRNVWCNDEKVQKVLKKQVPKKVINRLHSEGTTGVRGWNFDRAIREICEIWQRFWSNSVPGQKRASWRDKIDLEQEVENAQDPIDLADFRAAAVGGMGSRDVGAQLFCALLRSLALDCRLVCSLQALPLTSEAPKCETSVPDMIIAGEQDFGTGRKAPSTRTLDESPFPVWWVEIFSFIDQKWLPLDPIVRNTIDKPVAFEPPASDQRNSMAYVLAFEEDGTAKDVTRRYVKQFNGRTRKIRMDSIKDGHSWWTDVMQHFGRILPEDRDQIEDAALDRKLGSEGMPKNVQDFKGHPVYVLERHLRQNQVIEPKRECGKIQIGKASKAGLESVYRAQDVHTCRSADAWYRKGRDVMDGEQPLKRIVPRHHRLSSSATNDDSEEQEGAVALYAEFQTQVYIPPPVVDGRIPRNGYGNLDVYVSSMIPSGGVHVQHHLGLQAAKVLGLDAAEAVTGFKFKGRQGTAIVDGIVIAQQHTAAVLATISGLEQQLREEVNDERAKIVLGLWRKMMQVLRVRQRVKQDYGDKSGDNSDGEEEDSAYEDNMEDMAGGFFAGEGQGEATNDTKAEERAILAGLKDRTPIVLPLPAKHEQARVTKSPHALPSTAIRSATVAQDIDDRGSDWSRNAFIPNKAQGDETTGGGFVVQENDVESGGGFMPDDADVASDSPDQVSRHLEVDAAQISLTADRYDATPESSLDAASQVGRISIREGQIAGDERDANYDISPPPPKEDNGMAIGNAGNSTSWSAKKTAGDQILQQADDMDVSDASMQSQDPDEMDAEPQWVDDAFDSP